MTAQLIIIIVFYAIFLTGALIWGFSQIIGLIRARGVPYVPLSKKQLQKITENVKLQESDNLVDLGSGDGRVLRVFEKQGVKNLFGYEVNYWAYLLSRIKNKMYRSNAKIYFKNFKQVDLSQYNIIFCYLLEGCLGSLKEKFSKELKPGTKIVSYGFQVKDWIEPEIIYTDPANKNIARIFVYTIK